MDWSYVAGFFDGEGNIHINKITDKEGKIRAYNVALRFYNSDLFVLERIREFIGCGKIYSSKKTAKSGAITTIYELTIVRKKDTFNTLLTLSKHSICKKEKIDFLLNNYNFGYGKNDQFNLDKFHSMTSRNSVGNFYVKRDFKEYPTEPCPICSVPFIYTTRRLTCSEQCTSKLNNLSKTNRSTE